MVFFKTNVTSITGNLFYSDQSWHDCGSHIQVPFLNKLANVPIIGRLAGLIRIILASAHIVGHLCAALLTRNVEHLAHVVKGATEFLRGILEIIPIVGEIFSWCYNPSALDCATSHDCSGCDTTGNFFIVKIYNPDHPDSVDQIFNAGSKFPIKV